MLPPLLMGHLSFIRMWRSTAFYKDLSKEVWKSIVFPELYWLCAKDSRAGEKAVLVSLISEIFPPQLLKVEDWICFHCCSSHSSLLQWNEAKRGKHTVFTRLRSWRTLQNLVNGTIMLSSLLTACVWVLKSLHLLSTSSVNYFWVWLLESESYIYSLSNNVSTANSNRKSTVRVLELYKNSWVPAINNIICAFKKTKFWFSLVWNAKWGNVLLSTMSVYEDIIPCNQYPVCTLKRKLRLVRRRESNFSHRTQEEHSIRNGIVTYRTNLGQLWSMVLVYI